MVILYPAKEVCGSMRVLKNLTTILLRTTLNKSYSVSEDSFDTLIVFELIVTKTKESNVLFLMSK